MNQGAKVLVISRDEMLLQTRQLILGAYFQVSGAGRIQEAESFLKRCAFDLIVLCYSLSPSECLRVQELVRDQDPRPKILSLRAAGTEDPILECDAELMIEAGPFGLLKKSAEILGVDLKARPQGAYGRSVSAA